jgi:peptide/nickel transport system permease protein
VTGFYAVDSLLAGQWSTFADALWHLVLPALALGFLLFAVLVRLLRANLLGVDREHFLLVVKSKGVARGPAFVRHALPNAVLPTITAAGLLLAELLTGSVLVEKVFNWPGVGGLVVDSIQRKDYAVVQAFILLSALAYVLINALVDLAYLLIDPRTRLPGATQT